MADSTETVTVWLDTEQAILERDLMDKATFQQRFEKLTNKFACGVITRPEMLDAVWVLANDYLYNITEQTEQRANMRSGLDRW